MFANPWWSVLLIAAPAALYALVIRPRLKTRFSKLYAGLDSFRARLWARTYAFRTFWIGALGAVLTALPDLLVQISALDFSGLPQPWPMYVSIGTTLSIVLMKSFETKPREEK